VRVGAADSVNGSNELTVLTSFRTGQPLSFSGSCAAIDETSPCEAKLVVDFARTDGGDGGGMLSIDWSIEFSARTRKEDSPDEGPLDLPWTVEVTRL
jgi:hypothetical protein